jgi:hypothetical protein
LPDNQALLSEPIPCCQVSLDLDAIEQVLLCVFGVTEAATRVRHDGSLEAFVSVKENSELDSATVTDTICRLLPGYSVPDPVYVFSFPFVKSPQGDVDFDSMQNEVMRQNAASMSERQLLVRDIIANLLLAEPSKVNAYSDFFLLGGNSLLLCKLAYHIRKEMGVNVGVAALFTNSSISGIASLVAEEEKHASKQTLVDKNGRPKSSNDSDMTLIHDYDYDHDHDHEDPTKRSRGPNHPLSLIVQVIPIVFFYPLKSALTCKPFYLPYDG